MLMLRARRLESIDPRSWEHPADRAALAALRAIPGFDRILGAVLGLTSERAFRLLFVANAVKVTPTQFPRIKSMITRIAEVFDWPTVPDVFVTQSPFLNAGTYGVKDPFIVVNSSTLKSLDDDELCAVLAHEMGHVMSGHALYKTLLYLLVNVSLALIPGAEVAVLPIVLALREWDRKSELSADRAGLLAIQNEEPAYRLLMKMAGGDDVSQLNLNDFFEQAAEYDGQKTLLDSFHKLMNLLGASHPFAVIRLRELKTWAVDGHYQTIMSGMYLRRDHPDPKLEDELRSAWESYREEFGASDDILSTAARTAGDILAGAADAVGSTLKDLFGGTR